MTPRPARAHHAHRPRLAPLSPDQLRLMPMSSTAPSSANLAPGSHVETTVAATHARELAEGERFAFGENWRRFLRTVDEARVAASVASLQAMLGVTSLRGQRFLDVGSGSGLSSLAAHRMGAEVHAFDYDPSSVACSRELRRRFAPDAASWTIEPGNALDPAYLGTLGTFDVVYSWGVLHHTGSMWQALENVVPLVKPGGTLFVAIYNDQGARSGRWRRVKQLYCSGPLGPAAVCSTFIPAFVLRDLAADLVWMRNPMRRYSEYSTQRGMSVVHDWLDWLGGYPFEVARPEQIMEFYHARGFTLTRLRTCGGSVGCNEFVFRHVPAPTSVATSSPT